MKTLGWMPAAAAGLACWCIAAPQGGDEVRTRGLWNTEFSKQRPARKGVAPRPASSTAPFIGLTVWRLRQSQAADAARVRLLVHETERTLEFTPERVNAGAPLAEGERVRISIESARTGYLYVVSREKYRDGSQGEPYLIFPTLRLHGGDNHVYAGRVVEIPGWDDRPAYLTLRSSRPDQLCETLIVIVAPQPLPEVKPERSALRLNPGQLEKWQRLWGARVKSIDANGEAGKPLTEVEHRAAASGEVLRDGDPLPQTIYRVEARDDAALLVPVELTLLK